MKLFYREYGKGKPIIIAHGLFGMSDNWIRIAKQLAKNSKVYVLDLRNHGQSPHSEVHTYEAMSDDLLEFINDLGIEKAIFIGHSMGGKVVLQFANYFSERINKMIIVDISPKAYLHDANFINKTINHKKLFEVLKTINISKLKIRQEVLEIVSKYYKDIFILQLIQKNIIRNKEGKLSWKINVNALYSNFDEIRKEIILTNIINNIETLFIFGSKSPYYINEDVRFIKEKFKQVKFKVIKNAGHLLYIEKEKEFINAVLEHT